MFIIFAAFKLENNRIVGEVGQKHRFYDEFVPLWGFVSCVTQINKSITGFNGALAVALWDGLPLIPLLYVLGVGDVREGIYCGML